MGMCYDGTLVMPSSYAVMNEEEMTYVEGGGKVTVNIYFSKSTMQMNAAVAGAFVGGTLGYYLKSYVKNPLSAGVVAALVASTTALTAYAIGNGYHGITTTGQAGILIPTQTINITI